MRPAGEPPMVMSKYTLGQPPPAGGGGAASAFEED